MSRSDPQEEQTLLVGSMGIKDSQFLGLDIGFVLDLDII